MNIIIAGAGKVGFKLARTLSNNNNVYVIDKNKYSLEILNESLDIMPIIGDIVNPETYNVFLEKSFDIFISVTDEDEVNLLSTLIADDIINVKEKIIRLKNPYFSKTSITNKLNIKKAVFPFIATAKSIASLINFPKVNNIKKIPFTDFKLISIKANNPKYIYYKELNFNNCIVVGYERDKKLHFINKDIQILQNDLIYLFGNIEKIKQISLNLNTTLPTKIKNIAIFGASLLGIETAKLLSEYNLNIKIIDNNIDLCNKASEILKNNALVLHNKYTEHNIYEEDLKYVDMVIITHSNDEQNIIKALEAKEYNIKKTIIINNEIEYYDLMHKLDLTTIRGPKINAYYSIMESIASNSIINKKHYCGGRGVLIVRKIHISKTIKLITKYEILNLILRNNEIIKCDRKIKIEKNDILIIFTNNKFEEEVTNWINTL